MAQAPGSFDAIVQSVAGPLGAFVVLCGFVWGLFKRWIVIGWTYQDMKEDRDRWREIALSGTKLAHRAVDVIDKGP